MALAAVGRGRKFVAGLPEYSRSAGVAEGRP